MQNLQSPKMPDFQNTKPLPVIIDTDPGVDDLLALRSRELDVRAVCTPISC